MSTVSVRDGCRRQAAPEECSPARDGRPWPDGREHDKAPAARWSRDRHAISREADAVAAKPQRARSGRRPSPTLPQAGPAARGVADGCRPPSSTAHRRTRAAPRSARRRHRRWQLVLPRRHPPRRRSCRTKGIDYVDVGTSGGVWGLERGYCLMIGGDRRGGAAARPDLRARSPRASATPPHARARRRRQARPSRAISTAGRAGRGTSSRWCTTASSTD